MGARGPNEKYAETEEHVDRWAVKTCSQKATRFPPERAEEIASEVGTRTETAVAQERVLQEFCEESPAVDRRWSSWLLCVY